MELARPPIMFSYHNDLTVYSVYILKHRVLNPPNERMQMQLVPENGLKILLILMVILDYIFSTVFLKHGHLRVSAANCLILYTYMW